LEPKSGKTLSFSEITSKMEYYCSYQDRCHKEIAEKLKTFSLIPEAQEKILLHLIEHNFINEERFAKSFARGKHRYKNWGRIRITNELKFRDISSRLIQEALAEISDEEYDTNFNTLAEKHWNSIKEQNSQKKRKKFVDYLLYRGYESFLVFDKLDELEKRKIE
jgi:regulatory protein